MTVTIEAARPTDLPAVLALLERSGLPQDGLADHPGTTLVARSGDAVVGSATLEVYGGYLTALGCPRSGAVRSWAGWRLIRRALDVARPRGLATVYLLTETAGDFFPRFGFRRIERAAVEPAVQQSVEFISACPASAQVLVASLSSA